MSRLLDYIKAHEDNSGDDSGGPVDFDALLEKVNDIDWESVDEYVELLLRKGYSTGHRYS